ncbi:MAG: TRAP transporter small permease [Bacillota bacterium]
MKRYTALITGFSRALDTIAGLSMVAVMVLIVGNILLRVLGGRPFLGVYEYVVFLTAVMISLSLAHCAVQNGHIAVSFVVERMPLRVQALVDLLMNAITLFFWGLCAWQMGVYAKSTADSGLVSPTTQISSYPFIYLVAFGIATLSLVLLGRALESVKKAVVK